MFWGGLNGDGFFGEEYEDSYDVGYDHRENVGPSSKSCKFCGQSGLYWHKDNKGKWRLYDEIFTHNNQTLHVCGKYSAARPRLNNKIDIKLLGSKYHKHPDNKCGTGTNEFYETEYRLWGVSREKYWKAYRENSPKCPCCGTPRGFSFGTGDCGCDVGYNNPYSG
jgi:hypothetical protein